MLRLLLFVFFSLHHRLLLLLLLLLPPSPQYPNPLSRSLIQEQQNLQITASFKSMTRFFSLREEQSRFSPKGKHNPPTKKKKKISTVDAARTPTPTAKTAQRTREGACEGRKEVAGSGAGDGCKSTVYRLVPVGNPLGPDVVAHNNNRNWMKYATEFWNLELSRKGRLIVPAPTSGWGWSPSRPVWDVWWVKGSGREKKLRPIFILFLFYLFLKKFHYMPLFHLSTLHPILTYLSFLCSIFITYLKGYLLNRGVSKRLKVGYH